MEMLPLYQDIAFFLCHATPQTPYLMQSNQSIHRNLPILGQKSLPRTLQSPQTAPSLPQGVYDECAEKQTNSDANRYLNHARRHAENL